ncbi:glycerophosphodiester phosphodiesterase [Lactococcus allomyrinae]|uniref:Glycerophosphodiester phosphodiesterase n=1 Tax=Lactococcus allomyrinae TaxID=2419773 RepID=A0A387BSH4_9LACT|nr:glycerophosphodiester phosphodiesterase [Lactococcus allomyrinae]
MVIGLSNLINKTLRTLDKRKFGKSEKWLSRNQQMNHEVQTFVFAHRGSKCNRPENTLASFREAVRVHSDGIELDVHLSIDGELIVIHDEKIDRTTTGKGLVRKMTVAELKRFDAGSWFKEDFRGEKIPILSEVLSLLTDLHFTGSLNIEIKTDKYHYPGIEKKLSVLMKSQQWPFTHLYSSFNIDSLKILSEIEPDVELSYLTNNRLKKIENGLLTDFITSIHPRKSYAFKHPVLTALSNKPVRLWTVNSESEMRQAFHENVAGIITDYPEQAIRIRNQIQKQPNDTN